MAKENSPKIKKERVTAKEVIKNMNYNVKMTFSFYFLSSLGRGIWMGSVLSAFIYIFVGQTNGFLGLSQSEVLGLTSAASGIAMTVFVFPAGWLADIFRRDLILKIAAVLGIVALGFVGFGDNIVYMLIALFLWGLFNAFVRPSLEALFADSVTSGHRSKTYSWAHLVRQVAMALGPFINIPLLLIFGNEWDVTVLKNVMFVGLAISLLSIVMMFFFKDERALKKESEAIAEEVTAIVDEKEESRIAANLTSTKAAKIIPYLLVASNVIIGIGAGMTIKFFPVFFMEVYLISPIILQLIMGLTAVATGVLGIVAQKISLKLGRVQTIFVVQFTATACLLLITVYPPIGILAPVFILRGSFMNAAQPLSRSILMDIIPKKNRGKWNSVEAIAWGLFWNISAVLGGFLVGDNNNFNLCFIITTFVYIVGQIPIIILMPLVGQEKEAQEKALAQLQPSSTSETEIFESWAEEQTSGSDSDSLLDSSSSMLAKREAEQPVLE